MLDVYFEYNYGKVSEIIENGKCEEFIFESKLGIIRHMFIKRKIPLKCNDVDYYDLITPYGYGGPIIISCYDINLKEKLIEEFYFSFKKYCFDNNIVSEFIRFHPIFNNASDFSKIYDVHYIRNTLGTNLEDYDDPVLSEFSKSCRKTIRRSIDAGVSYKITTSPKSLENFKEIYYSTMDRNNASEFYYFNNKYFEESLKYLREYIVITEAVYKDKTIAMGYYFKYKDIIHMHLSGTLNDYLYLSPAYILKYGITIWGKENNCRLIHHGGGKSNNEDDSLYQFKKKFSKNTEFKFYVGKKIWNIEVYNQLCEIHKSSITGEYFPAYRE